MIVRTRFAPSPTGNLHFGNIRTALYAWLFARQQQGKFLLRIENTNLQYNNINNISNIINVMEWLNLDWDEGPVFQTDRFDRYNHIINDMLNRRIAYKCYCSSERLEWLRLEQLKCKRKPKYDGHCRNKNSSVKLNNINSYVVRFSNPKTGTVTFHDQIRGVITFNNNELDDLIIKRANGIPTYNFCVVVDDMDMHITHVIRGEEHINNTPRQINILKSLNADIPIYAHLPMILDANRKKLSKRRGIEGVMQYHDDGFLPEAILNYLVRLGWSYGNREIFSIEQMKKYFSFNAINKSASIFDIEKLLWYNRYYMNNLPTNCVVGYLSKYMIKQDFDYKSGPELSKIVKFFSKRSNTLKDFMNHCVYLYKDFDIFKNSIAKDYLVVSMITPLQLFKEKVTCISCWTIDYIKIKIEEMIQELGLDINIVAMPIRVALTGTNRSPELSIVTFFIGKVRVLKRIDQAICYIKQVFL